MAYNRLPVIVDIVEVNLFSAHVYEQLGAIWTKGHIGNGFIIDQNRRLVLLLASNQMTRTEIGDAALVRDIVN